MKNILKYAVCGAALLCWACQDDTVSEPTLQVFTDKTTYKVGEEIRFNFSGYADYMTIYYGNDNYNGGTLGGAFKGSRYIYRDRASEEGVATLTFNCKRDNATAANYANVQLKLMVSTDFSPNITGPITLADIHAATWTDISDRVNWPTTTTNLASGAINLSEWNGQPIHVALKYTAAAGVEQVGWTISSFVLNNKVPTDATAYAIWANGSGAKCGAISNIINPTDTRYTMYNWVVGNTLTCKGGSGAGSEALESWAVASATDPSKVDPDYGTVLKSYSTSVPDFQPFTYWKAGTFTATIVSRNANTNGNKEVVQNIELTIEE